MTVCQTCGMRLYSYETIPLFGEQADVVWVHEHAPERAHVAVPVLDRVDDD